jgi:hypothetical protein
MDLPFIEQIRCKMFCLMVCLIFAKSLGKLHRVFQFPFSLVKPSSSDLSIYGSTARVDLGRFFSLSFTQSVGLLGRIISQSQGRYLYRTTQTQNKRTQTSMPRVGFEPTIPVF